MRERIKTGVTIAEVRGTIREALSSPGAEFNFSDRYTILPGFSDVHVHLREPGFFYKESIRTGTLAAAAGGFTHVLTMPNLDPVPDSPAHLKVQTDIIRTDACVGVHPLGSLTCGEQGRQVSDIEGLAPHVAGFSDDGAGVMDDGLMKEAMTRVKAAGSITVAHCEDTRYPRESREAEFRQLDRDLDLVAQTGCPYHMCHVSTLESLKLIRQAKRAGLDVTCETAPHYLTLSDQEIEADGRFKMNPPIKTPADKEALLEALTDGTIDMIATDHAPHSQEEKSKGFAGSAYGIVGLETAFPVLYTKLVKEGILPMEHLIELLTEHPNRRFQIGSTMPDDNDPAPTFTVWDLETPYEIDPAAFLSKGRSTPFAGWQVQGKCMLTVMDGKVVYRREQR